MSLSPTATILPILPKLNSQLRVVLGSGSPRRRELLQQLGIKSFEVVVSNFPEDLDRSNFPTAKDYCLATAFKKVEAVASGLVSGSGGDRKTLVIGADTIVEIDGQILEKPSDDDDSTRMLQLLSGRPHFVHTAVIGFCNCNSLDDSSSSISSSSATAATTSTPTTTTTTTATVSGFPYSFAYVESSVVHFAQLSAADVTAYVASGEGRDKAGSYGIQGGGALLVRRIEGCYFNVMGLPLHSLSNHIAQLFKDSNENN